MAFGDDWATFDNVYGGAASTGDEAWYDGALDAVTGFAGDLVDGADNWLGQLMTFELKKEQLGYQNQLANQTAVLTTVESDQQTGSVPASPNYRQIEGAGSAGGNNRLLMLAALGLVVYLAVK